ncbi:hypothetical protein R3P38DRAFT_2555857, partial [Favolaschia claudopus]
MSTAPNADFPLYWGSRLSCTAGYYTPPQVYSKMKFELRRIPQVTSRVVKDGQGRRWELWSPNSIQTPFLPGWRAPGPLPPLPASEEERRYDGHLGRMDCLFSPHYSGEFIAHWPYLRRPYSVPSNDFAYAAYEPLMNQWDVDSRDHRKGSFRLEFIHRLNTLRSELDSRMEAMGARLRGGSTTWANRPQYTTSTIITELMGVRSWGDAVDRGVGAQRGLREKEAWLSMTHARRVLGRATMDQLRGVRFPRADERFIGVWVNGINEGAVLANMYAGIPCFIVHSYAAEDLTRAEVDPAIPTPSDFVTGTDVITAVLDSPYQKLARLDAFRLDVPLRPSKEAVLQVNPSPEEEKLSSSLYLEQLGVQPDSWKKADFDANPEPFDLLGWRKGSAVQTANPQAPLIFVPPPAPAPTVGPALGDPSTKQDKFAHQELEKQVIDPDRVAWIVPPPVAEAAREGKWAMYELEELESGRTAFIYRGKSNKPETDEKFFDRVKKRRLYMGEYEVPAGVLNKGVFGVPVPRYPFVIMDGIKERMEKPSFWMYKKEAPLKGDAGKKAETPRAEELPFLPGRG